VLSDLAEVAEGVAFAGVAWPVLAVELSPLLPGLAVVDVEGYVHRLLVEFSDVYRGVFDRALELMGDGSLGGGELAGRVSGVARSAGLDDSVVSVWARHVGVLSDGWGEWDPVGDRVVLEWASGYLNARIGGVRVGGRSPAERMLFDERLLRVASKLRGEGEASAVAEAEVIGREMYLPRRGRLVGGSGHSAEYAAYLDAVAALEEGLDSTFAESSASAGGGSAAGVPAPVVSVQGRREQEELLAYVSEPAAGVSPGLRRNAESWLLERGRRVVEPSTGLLTGDALGVLKPLVLALAAADVSELGGVDTGEMLARLFTPESTMAGTATVRSWLTEADIRVLTDAEVPIAR
ncbi:hypothetical protein, partial [Streptomyces sp. NPDC059185]